ncbi:MAG: bifunctional oligoribonuclease/PAP phosphatase NrnA [Bacteroidetes Order II. Incertae sedis bacterium]|jgi:phosphoesterase RecJ-like protein|nr:bifunctional oligoribonuclease/PAP phosphatase NrnA [Bacteroidetes Order II. bacterium]MBT4603662.1 bifunctional oligoribonuclease/PAP phosphatase NrnA [Bacteroidetes Order II. bacterium]MBT5249782.1 bifunctional oligoribonuclease/PAP phosphatase NrnA [Bacteroidetes Order II. bacterium]MBT6201708.1 bifunctional oligoribonuclease/PAP phosphatase NrnA [Bacteroidetes Order II. bacterium]MBT6424812.1 bifunctional oligoribonuclease/PAP phosphatase NrnA [Bacteroidetes Order II. bacterium]
MPATIVSALKDAQRVVITTHTRPDGDAVGSQLALGHFLKGQGKDVLMVNQDACPYNMEWLPGVGDIQLYKGSLAQVEFIAKADLAIVLDTNAASRIGTVGPQFKGTSALKVLIDHHTDPESWFDLMYRKETASSTGELLFDLFEAWDLDAIDYQVAAPLYVAILTDTGSFRFSSVTPRLHRVVAELIERGSLDVADLHAQVYDKKSREGLQLMSKVFSTIETHFDGAVGSMVVSRRFLADTGAPVEETEGFVNHLLTIEGVRIALIFTETAGGTKVSFRSKGDYHVHKWAQAFGGGGHRNASGAFIKEPLEQAMKKAINAAPRYTSVQDEDQESLSAEDAAYLSSLMNSQN